MEGITEIKRKDWSIVYNPEFEQYKEKYKNIVSTVNRVMAGEKIENFENEMLGYSTGGKAYSVVEVAGEKFFIKKIPENHKQGGVEEFKAALEAKNRLRDGGIKNVKVVDYVFGYSSDKVRFVVSRYDSRLKTTLALYMDECVEKKKYNELHKLDHRFADLKKLFADYFDFKVQNMAYDKDTDEIILFDLNNFENKLIESTDDEL